MPPYGGIAAKTLERNVADPGSVSDLLADLLDGRSAAPAVGGEAASLAMLARRCERLAVPGPSPASEVHIRTRVIAMMEGNHAGRPWLSGWLGGAAPRPLRERLAAGALLFAVAGGSASVATGVSPVDFASGVGEFARSVVVNLTPGDSTGGTSIPTPDASPSQTTPALGQATIPGQSATASPGSTPGSTPGGIGSTASADPPSTAAPNQTGGPSPVTASPTAPTASTGTPSPVGGTATQTPTAPGPQQTTTPIPSPGSSSTPDAPDDSDNRTRTPEPGDDSGGGSSGSGNSGSGSSGSGSSGSGSSGSGSDD